MLSFVFKARLPVIRSYCHEVYKVTNRGARGLDSYRREQEIRAGLLAAPSRTRVRVTI